MAYWVIKRLKVLPNLLIGRNEITAQMLDKESGETKYAETVFTGDLTDFGVEGYLCILQEDQGFTPNDFNVTCV